jgi:hypothetical protein
MKDRVQMDVRQGTGKRRRSAWACLQGSDPASVPLRALSLFPLIVIPTEGRNLLCDGASDADVDAARADSSLRSE